MIFRAIACSLALLAASAAISVSVAPAPAYAGGAFCAGFSAGWAAAFRNHGRIPGITPICPIPPIGRDTYEGGFEMGMIAALQSM